MGEKALDLVFEINGLSEQAGLPLYTMKGNGILARALYEGDSAALELVGLIRRYYMFHCLLQHNPDAPQSESWLLISRHIEQLISANHQANEYGNHIIINKKEEPNNGN